MMRSIFISLFIVFFSCDHSIETMAYAEEEIESPKNNMPNILLIIADDMGLDASPGYDIGIVKPHMPNLQSLMTSGIKFTNLWANPTCSPTRATILTGKYGFKTGVLDAGDILSASETSLQSYIDTNSSTSYNHAVIGKWHLSNNENHPNNMGINHFAGLIGGGVQSYWNWNLTINGITTKSTEYTTTKFTDLAINWVAEQTTPWFLWLAYNAPHTPFHLPPNDLHSQGALPSDQASIDSNPLPYYMAALEAMDAEMGRLINSMSTEEKDNTVIIFIGDNGTPNQVVQEHPPTRAKGSIYQGGINVPMIVSGKNVIRMNETENALINTTDLFATIANIAGTSDTGIHDSKSFKSLLTSSDNSSKRAYVYAENEDFTIRNATHKYIHFNNGSEALFNLNDNPLESPNLLNANQGTLSNNDATVKLELTTKLSEIRH
ncbi:sulfatase-like hydrolase/transferase [Flavivirga sp. 57AJ16]|uniref:sulfatase-like hydrolase/transferase n=1 Tax=Flavivirga sp. 57AJ16 TaxID=3025307 RepID=UPI002366B6DF|nr:sulfatase-like hydrolase/transferase [Flavivirga sp. 57AJ16]MDD7885717.1 sulfatase-like hydrolase/transferase [Flavivirga sp. 57AJ16]